MHGELAHDDGGEHHDGADRQVDTGGQDDQRLGGANDAGDGHLLQDQRQREGGEEFRAEKGAEHRHRQKQHDQRHGSRAAM